MGEVLADYQNIENISVDFGEWMKLVRKYEVESLRMGEDEESLIVKFLN